MSVPTNHAPSPPTTLAKNAALEYVYALFFVFSPAKLQIILPVAEQYSQPCGVYNSTLSWVVVGDGALVKVGR